MYGAGITFAGNEFGVSGLIAGDSVTSVTLTSAGAPAPANAGSYAITASAATGTGLANYTISYIDGTLIVAQATPVITWNNPADIVYGTALGGTQLDATADVGGTFVYGPVSGTVLNAGNGQSLGVSFTPTDSLNYTTANATVAINVNPASLTITADDQSRGYGGTNPVFTAGYNGFVNNDGSGVLNGTLSFSCLDTNEVVVDTKRRWEPIPLRSAARARPTTTSAMWPEP